MINSITEIATMLAHEGICGIALLLAAIMFANVIFLLIVAAITGNRMTQRFFNFWMIFVPALETVGFVIHVGAL